MFSGAECSTSKNPLAQFANRGINTDTSLHKGPSLLHGPSSSSSSSSFPNQMAQERAMSANDATKFNQFYHSDNNHGLTTETATSPNVMAMPLNMQSMNRELASIQRSMIAAGGGASRSMTGAPTATTASNNWSQEFNSPGTTSVTMAAKTSTNAAISQNFSGQGHYQPRFMNQLMFANSAMARMDVGGQAPQVSNQNININWDDHFKDVEQEISSSKEKLQVVDDEEEEEEEEVVEEILSSNTQAQEDGMSETFEELWNNMKQNDDIDYDNIHNGFLGGNSNSSMHPGFDVYKFEDTENNQFLDLDDPYSIGLQLMENGAKLSEAALAFEAAVQKDPKHIDAWLKLGEVQSANEKEKPGIIAYNQVLKLDPHNLTALMNSAIGYINEGYDNSVSENLKQWIFTKYPQSAAIFKQIDQTKETENSETGMHFHYLDRFASLTETFLSIIRADPATAGNDADLQLGLGALFYATGDFNKTIDCFQTALRIQPNDEILWNRLGAALANSNRSEEAINAYYRALQLKPSFVRARYNLGVSCINIGCYKEAAEHLLAGLSLHKVEGGKDIQDGEIFNIDNNQSNSLLESLKRVFLSMERHDLLDKVEPNMNLDQFRKEFNF
ncbi:Pex5 protein [Saccharomycopsis crataegensis]|uniref:Pex5 protein n=1 Tax=Saccharomycopsis crataegensis TaxID=43959 RepID=A0AAV5QJ34_9ASCO|nr:Pex5 protein [Saccharomycopsis crataegensis]